MRSVPPVLLMAFNRPDLVAEVLRVLRVVRPPQLFVSADGPRAHHSTDHSFCAETRAVIQQMVDWPCEVKTLFHESNLGCRRAVQRGISWFFDEVPEGIILEDDTVPLPDFFPFCSELLERYRDDERIGMISGNNFQSGFQRGDASYYYSRFTFIWGWASWRRAWRHYDPALSTWPVVRDGAWLHDMLVDEGCVGYWRGIFDQMQTNRIDTWDFQWTYSCWVQNMFSVIPNQNLVKNLGFGPSATHTTGESWLSNLPTQPLVFPLQHPSVIIPDLALDLRSARDVFGIKLGAVGQSILARTIDRPAATEVELISEAFGYINSHDFARALQKLDQFSLTGARPENLEYLRAICFLQLDRKADARCALQQELQSFPAQEQAQSLLRELERH